LHGRRLLVAHLLGWVTILLGWWSVALLLRRVLSLRRAECDVLANYSMLFNARFAMRVGLLAVSRELACLPVGLLRVLRTAVIVALAGHCVRCAYAIGSGWVVLLGCARSVAVGWLG
jgi:hypothetical protein